MNRYTYDDLDLPDDYYITIHQSKFHTLQGGVFHDIKCRLSYIWNAIRGKGYRFCEINITEDQIDELIKALEDIKK